MDPTPSAKRPNWGGARRGAGAPRGPRPLTVARERVIEAFARQVAGDRFPTLAPREILEAAARGLVHEHELELAAYCLRRAARLSVNRSRTPS